MMHTKVELFIKLWVVFVMNKFVYDILTKIKIVFGADYDLAFALSFLIISYLQVFPSKFIKSNQCSFSIYTIFYCCLD